MGSKFASQVYRSQDNSLPKCRMTKEMIYNKELAQGTEALDAYAVNP